MGSDPEIDGRKSMCGAVGMTDQMAETRVPSQVSADDGGSGVYALGRSGDGGEAACCVEVHPDRIDAGFLQRVPLAYAVEHLVVSLGVNERGEHLVAVSGRASDACVLHNLSVRLGAPVLSVRADAESIRACLDAAATRSSSAPETSAEIEALGLPPQEELLRLLEEGDRDLLKVSGREPVVRLVNSVIFEALHRRASDVHAQIAGDRFRVRLRIDGVMRETMDLPIGAANAFIGRVKVLARLDLAERRLPQDGRTTVSIGDRAVDLRISTLPTSTGERLVIRLLDRRPSELRDLEGLGMPAEVRKTFARLCGMSHGMILLTGPTGSGKTTTLYSALQRMPSSELNIMTLEDPVEYDLPGISQTQINTRKGVTFATGLRHVLRQDPDVIMVGEVRDAETARMAVQAALTGHLVFSTLHTNDAASAVTRLVDLGVEPYLVTASLLAVMAQRLVRRRCSACGADAEKVLLCGACEGSGWRGRIGLFELLLMTPEVQELVAGEGGLSEIRAAARRAGMRTLRESGRECIARGLTTQEELDRVTLATDALDAMLQTVADHGGA